MGRKNQKSQAFESSLQTPNQTPNHRISLYITNRESRPIVRARSHRGPCQRKGKTHTEVGKTAKGTLPPTRVRSTFKNRQRAEQPPHDACIPPKTIASTEIEAFLGLGVSTQIYWYVPLRNVRRHPAKFAKPFTLWGCSLRA